VLRYQRQCHHRSLRRPTHRTRPLPRWRQRPSPCLPRPHSNRPPLPCRAPHRQRRRLSSHPSSCLLPHPRRWRQRCRPADCHKRRGRNPVRSRYTPGRHCSLPARRTSGWSPECTRGWPKAAGRSPNTPLHRPPRQRRSPQAIGTVSRDDDGSVSSAASAVRSEDNTALRLGHVDPSRSSRPVFAECGRQLSHESASTRMLSSWLAVRPRHCNTAASPLSSLSRTQRRTISHVIASRTTRGAAQRVAPPTLSRRIRRADGGRQVVPREDLRRALPGSSGTWATPR
jgi:hypothetical protein